MGAGAGASRVRPPAARSRWTGWTAVALVAVALLAAGASTASAHGGSGPPVRPARVNVEPAVQGLHVTAVHMGAWQLRVENRTAAELAVLDDGGRSFLRIGPDGVWGDYASRAWYESNSADSAIRVPEGAVGPGGAPDFRLVSTEPVWSFFDARFRADDVELPGDADEATAPFRVKRWSVPVVHGGRAGAITGDLEYEPVVGRYRHHLTSPPALAEGVTAGLVAGLAVPAVTLEVRSGEPVTVLGPAGDRFARVGRDGVHVNVHSPMWAEILQSRGQTPVAVADASAEPRWQRVFGDPRWSWPEFRGRPPDTEPPPPVVGGDDEVVVKRWTVPLDVGGRRVEIRGATSFVPLGTAAGRPGRLPLVAALGIGSATVAVAAALLPGRRRGLPGHRQPSGHDATVRLPDTRT